MIDRGELQRLLKLPRLRGATTGLGGALGIVVGLLAGSLTGCVMLYPRRA